MLKSVVYPCVAVLISVAECCLPECCSVDPSVSVLQNIDPSVDQCCRMLISVSKY